MGFNIFASPFEKMSQENQQAMVDELSEINLALSDSSHPYFAAIINISDKINQLVEINKSIKTAITEGPSGGDGMKAAELQALGVTVEMFGKGLTMIVDAVKAYSTVDGKVFDSLIDGITKMGEGFKKSEKAFEFFLKVPKLLGMLALGIIGLGIGLVIALPLYAVGIVAVPLVVFVIKKLLMALGGVFEAFEDGLLEGGARALKQIAASIVLFGLAIALSGPIYLVAALSMIPILLVLGIFLTIFKIIASKGLDKSIGEGAQNLKQIAWSIALFGIAIALIGPLYIMGAVFILPILLTLILFVGVMWLLSKVDKDVKQGAYALWMIGVAIVIFGLALYFWHKLAPSWEDILQTIVVIGAFALMLYLVGQRAKDMMKAAIALIIGAVAMIILSVALKMLLDSVDRDWEQIGMVGAIIGGFGLALVLIGNFGGNILMGAAALIVGAVAMIVLGVGIGIILDAVERDWEQIGMVGATLAMIGLEFGLMGIPVVAAFIILGAAAGIVAGTALVLIGAGLATFKASGWENGDESLLQSAISGIRNAFLGLDGDEGFFGTIAAIGSSMILAAAMVPIALMYIPAGIALVAIGASLVVFKKLGFTSRDADNMKYVISSVADAFTAPFLNKFGMIDWGKLMRVNIGVWALSKAGKTLAGLAEGVQEWANLTAPVWEYDEKSGEMKVKRKVKLTERDFKRMASGMKSVISAISGPFADVGKLEMGESPNDPFYASIFGGKRYVSRGVRALSLAGSTMSGLAQGVQDWANMTITEYDVVETKDGPELRPVKKRQLKQTEIDAATDNVARVAMSVARVFAEIGKINEGEAPKDPMGALLYSVFGGDLVKSGVQSLAGIGDIISGLATGIQQFAGMEFVTNKIMINSETGMPELVPDKVTKLNQGDIDTAVSNIASMAMSMALVFSKLGQDDWSWFGMHGKDNDGIDPDDTKEGIESLGGISDVIQGLALGIQSFAKMQFVSQKVTINSKTGIPELTPDKVITLTQKDIDNAIANIAALGIGMAKAMSQIGQYITDDMKEEMEEAVEVLAGVSSGIGTLAKSIGDINVNFKDIKPEDLPMLGNNIGLFMGGVLEAFRKPNTGAAVEFFGLFTEDFEIMTDSADEWKSVAESFDSVATSMGVFKDEINDLDLEVLSETKALFQAMAVVAEAGSISDLLSKFGGSIEETFEKLAELLSKFADTVSTSSASTANSIANMGAPAGTVSEAAATTDGDNSAATAELSKGIKEMLGSLESIDSQLRGTIKTKQAMF